MGDCMPVPHIQKFMEMNSVKALWDILIHSFTCPELYDCVFGGILVFALILYAVRLLVIVMGGLKRGL